MKYMDVCNRCGMPFDAEKYTSSTLVTMSPRTKEDGSDDSTRTNYDLCGPCTWKVIDFISKR